MFFVEKQLARFRTSYLSVWTVLTGDVLISLIASFIVLSAANITAESTIYARDWFAFTWLVTALLASSVAFLTLRTHYIIIRHTGPHDLLKFLLMSVFKGVCLLLVIHQVGKATKVSDIMAAIDSVLTLVLLVCTRAVMIRVYDFYKSRVREIQSRVRILVYGTGDKAVSIIVRLRNSPH